SCRGLYFASRAADAFLISSESTIAFCTLTTATFNWADAILANGASARHSRPARIARETDIIQGLLRMENHRLAQVKALLRQAPEPVTNARGQGEPLLGWPAGITPRAEGKPKPGMPAPISHYCRFGGVLQ